MEIELGLLGAVAIMGIALQMRIHKVLRRKLSEIRAEQTRLEKDQVSRAAERFASMDEEKAEWEREHPTLQKHGRQDSTMSSTLLRDTETAVGFPDGDEKRRSTLSLGGLSPRPRYQSGVSSLMTSTPVDGRQSPGAIPALDLGINLESDVPRNYLTDGKDSDGKDTPRPRNSSSAMSLMADLDDLKEKERLLNEIQTIRKSLDILKSETPAPSTTDESRRPSFSSRRTLSHDFGAIPLVGPSNLRPQTADPRARVHSMDLLNRNSVAGAIGRPTSVPLQGDDGWEAYVADRTLFTPPSGVTAPIPTSPLPLISPTPRPALSPAVTEALIHRQQREAALTHGRLSPVPDSTAEQQSPPILPKERKHTHRVRSPEDLPIALRPQSHAKSNSQESYAPGIILPPHHRHTASPPPQSRPDPARVLSFEELDDRHRQHLRQLQQPVTEAQTEQAEIQAARSRWERAKELEKQAVTKRQAERAAIVNKQAKEQEKQRKSADAGRHSISLNDDLKARGHQRSLSADVLAAQSRDMSRSSRRYSMMKVEDWQKHQIEDLEFGRRPRERPSGSHQTRESSSRNSGVPFPEAVQQRPSREGRRMSGMPGRDPVN